MRFCTRSRVSKMASAMNSSHLVLLSDKIKAEDLLQEVEKFETKVVEAEIKTSKEREVIELSKSLVLVEKLMSHELSPQEWKTYEEKKANIANLEVRLKQPDLAQILKPFEKFNQAAIARNEVLVNNLMRRAADGKTAYEVAEEPSPSPVYAVKIKKVKETSKSDGKLESLVLNFTLTTENGDRPVTVAVSDKKPRIWTSWKASLSLNLSCWGMT